MSTNGFDALEIRPARPDRSRDLNHRRLGRGAELPLHSGQADREACYKRQEEELASKRKPAAPVNESKLETLRQMRQDDDAVYRSINNICRGC